MKFLVFVDRETRMVKLSIFPHDKSQQFDTHMNKKLTRELRDQLDAALLQLEN